MAAGDSWLEMGEDGGRVDKKYISCFLSCIALSETDHTGSENCTADSIILCIKSRRYFFGCCLGWSW